ncbi:MAG: tRNA pseudouridine(38-40) synthase TruA [Propionibacteriaceae bacterium]
MTRYRLDLAYDGTNFSGWAVQPGMRTVQSELEHWLGLILRLPEEPRVTVAGRTDAGVHAQGQVCHVDLDGDNALRLLQYKLPRALPSDIVLRSASVAPDGFDARFSAIWRRYCYRLTDPTTPTDPLKRGYVVACPQPLDVDLMNSAATELLGLRDFVAFSKKRDGATTIRTLQHLETVRTDSGVIETTVRADAFCRSMVRSLMGALVAVGSGQRDMEWLRITRDAGIRSNDTRVMAARGLVLEEVGYPEDALLAARASEARATRSREELEQTRAREENQAVHE